MKHLHHRRPEPRHLLALTEHLSEVTAPLIAGLLAGFLALIYLRQRRLSWSWGLVALVVSWPLWLIAWKLGLTWGIASGIVAGAGAYWHAEDLKRGGEEARAARDALSPWGWWRARQATPRAAESRVTDDMLALGSGRAGRPSRVPFGSHRGVHGVVLGATGSGKTVTQAAIAQTYVLAGLPAIVIDPKGDRYLRAVLIDAAAARGARFREWTPTGPTVYNPFARGGPTEITDKVLAGQRWSEPHYELATQRLLGQVLGTMRAAGKWPPTISEIVGFMDPDRLDALACGVGGEVGAQVSAYVDGLSARAKSDLGGGRDRLAILGEGELGPWLDPALGKGPNIDLEESLRRGDVIYMHLDADRYPAASKLLAAALVIDLVTLTADLQRRKVPGLVVVDEFAALAAEQVHRLFGRARSAGLSVLLGTQSLADLRGARPDDPSDTLTEQVLTNVEYAVVHRQSDPDSAERLARVAGTQPSWSTTEKVGGSFNDTVWGRREGTRTREREFVVLPDEFKSLATGEAVVINLGGKSAARIVGIWQPRARQAGR